MPVRHVIGLFINPKAEWQRIRDSNHSIAACIVGHTMLFALIPAVSGFIGTTQIGWQIGAGAPLKLTAPSAGQIAVLFSTKAAIAAVICVGIVIRLIGQTYPFRAVASRSRAAP